MKKMTAVLLWLLLISVLFSLRVQAGGISVKVNGQAVAFDVQPTIIDGRTMVSMRAIFDALGAHVIWDGSNGTITGIKNDTTIKIILGKNIFYKNGNAVALDVPAQIVSGRTMVPVRVVAQSFSCGVLWDDITSTVIITTDTELDVHFMDVG